MFATGCLTIEAGPISEPEAKPFFERPEASGSKAVFRKLYPARTDRMQAAPEGRLLIANAGIGGSRASRECAAYKT